MRELFCGAERMSSCIIFLWTISDHEGTLYDVPENSDDLNQNDNDTLESAADQDAWMRKQVIIREIVKLHRDS